MTEKTQKFSGLAKTPDCFTGGLGRLKANKTFRVLRRRAHALSPPGRWNSGPFYTRVPPSRSQGARGNSEPSVQHTRVHGRGPRPSPGSGHLRRPARCALRGPWEVSHEGHSLPAAGTVIHSPAPSRQKVKIKTPPAPRVRAGPRSLPPVSALVQGHKETFSARFKKNLSLKEDSGSPHSRRPAVRGDREPSTGS